MFNAQPTGTVISRRTWIWTQIEEHLLWRTLVSFVTVVFEFISWLLCAGHKIVKTTCALEICCSMLSETMFMKVRYFSAATYWSGSARCVPVSLWSGGSGRSAGHQWHGHGVGQLHGDAAAHAARGGWLTSVQSTIAVPCHTANTLPATWSCCRGALSVGRVGSILSHIILRTEKSSIPVAALPGAWHFVGGVGSSTGHIILRTEKK